MIKKIRTNYIQFALILGLVAGIVVSILTTVKLQLDYVLSHVVPGLCGDDILPPQVDEDVNEGTTQPNLEQQPSSFKPLLFGAVAAVVVSILTLLMPQVRSLFSNLTPELRAPPQVDEEQLPSSPKRRLLGAAAAVVVVILAVVMSQVGSLSSDVTPGSDCAASLPYKSISLFQGSN